MEIHKRRLNLPPVGQLYDSRYSPVQARYSYTKSIQQIHNELKKKKLAEIKKLKDEEKKRQKELEAYQGKCARIFWKIWSKTFAKLGEDWIILAIVGICMACISYSIDKGVMMCNRAQWWLYSTLAYNYFSKWVAWISLPFCLIMWNVGLTHLLAPKAAGSGLPQIKTSLRGVFMKEFFTFRVLIVKWLGITATLGSGLPLGREGPLIHMASVIVTKLSKLVSGLNKIYGNENKKIEMLGAAWAVGVACTFNAPIGGVLFSVEITTAYFAVRNYWRGFYTAVWGATFYRLLLVWIDRTDTITVVFKTNFFVDFPYDAWELISFGILGFICGLCGSFYIWCKQLYGKFSNENFFIKGLKKANRFLYPALVILINATVTWPSGAGQFFASDIPGGAQVKHLFSNYSWTKENLTVSQHDDITHWTTKWTNIYPNLVVYIVFQFVFSIIGSTLPIPNGSFIPNFRCGAALGRIVGELIHTWFPLGLTSRGKMTPVLPGAYATVGAAAWAGAVTHTMSVCVILFEMTSTISHVIPVLIAVLIANGVARFLTPSIYDLVIQSKKLPYLPDLLPNTSSIYNVYVEDFMVTNVKYAHIGMTYKNLQDLLTDNKKLKIFPLVDNPQTMTLLGSIPRQELILLLDKRIGAVSRRQVLPSPRVTREEDEDEEDLVEYIPMRKKSSVHPIEDSSSESEKEEGKEKKDEIEMKESKGKEEAADKTDEEKRSDIFKKWSVDKGTAPKSPRPDRKPAASMTHLEVPRLSGVSAEQLRAWEDEIVDFTTCGIDPAPFQLVERTSLLKVHSLFSMLAINFAYVTYIGKLVGVVSLNELRQAIEDTNSGEPPHRERAPLPVNLNVPQQQNGDKSQPPV